MIFIMHSFPNIEENLFFDNGGPHLHTHNMHIILQHLSDSMIILDHGNICVDTNFMILPCIVFQILTKLGVSIMAARICIHIYMHIHKTTFFDHVNIMCRPFLRLLYSIVAKILKKIDISVMAALIGIFTQLLKVVQRTTKLNFFRDPMGL